MEVERRRRRRSPEVEEEEGLMKCSPLDCPLIVHEISRGQLHHCLQKITCLYSLLPPAPVSTSQSINQYVSIHLVI
jgi:hypothetical protein